ncbi:heme d1 biosynthesis radical SAM protein NirJ [Pseudomonas schmalbachii]|uniref:Heme d1 biosynthesis radical SAM protein NirJ n=1 Tax=Pseudomonas schmalbachii TaxID=2816993 RepID=A0ABS3TW61_9PSED|nr:heme d1 biosynthesis radical SAM protein NirJ [Pseudomonas schmalbachii]MBO3277925.1 heme d1 biosynthesis radical SAM protein NirJ [Pseudomonas schmalbachii]
MLRISHYLRSLDKPEEPSRSPAAGTPRPPVVIWNLLRRCNLTCKHCYSTSADSAFRDELPTAEILRVIDDLHTAGVRVMILSGGEPLLHPDLFEIAAHARASGMLVALSSNGTLIGPQNIQRIVDARFDYVGISLDGLRETHDRFRQLAGSFDSALGAMRLCREAGIRVGMRTTLTEENASQLPALLDMMRELDVQKFYLSHLNYSGRGRRSRKLDAHHQRAREAVELLFARADEDIRAGRDSDFVTGNNDADAVLLLGWVERHRPWQRAGLERMLRQWGGNASGAGIANIDNTGEVHPDTYWWHHSVGNVRHRRFAELWFEQPDPLLLQLRQHPRPVGGRCSTCRWLDICNGNTRTRAWAGGDLWGEDPGCHLTDAEIGMSEPQRIPLEAV